MTTRKMIRTLGRDALGQVAGGAGFTWGAPTWDGVPVTYVPAPRPGGTWMQRNLGFSVFGL